MRAPWVEETATALECFRAPVRQWFREAFDSPTPAQVRAWPVIARGRNTLLLAPTGSGKTLAAFLVAIDRLMFGEPAEAGVQVLYVTPLKALGVDVERNLRSPLAGVRKVAERDGFPHRLPSVGVRSGDTPAGERLGLLRRPPDILITTPESLYLLLTSRARDILQPVRTVIVDEIHSLVGNKRGAHLFVSLERLEHLRRAGHSAAEPLQRIGLSATQRPLEEVARLLGGAEATSNPDEPVRPRAVEIVEAGSRKQLDLRIEVPVEDLAQLPATGPAAGPAPPSIWPSIHPRLVELIRGHRSTMVFVNSRRLAERLAAAVNELAGEELALAHHGSLARDARLQIEDRLKRGQLPAIVATSSLELGIDMGSVDLVIQIEAPPSVASGIQRIGRAGHQVGVPSSGILFPKYRGDLLACAAASERMMRGEVEPTYYPRNPLDVLAQQIVAMVALEERPADELYATVRGAAPFHDLPPRSFEAVLDLLSGRYPSDEFAEFRPRISWDRITGQVAPRRGTQRLAVLNAGTIPDRGLYGVYLAEGEGRGSRVGELDEEMVFETRVGEVFLLGASSWRVLDITQDRVLVTPAPGEPGRMPFWRGDGPGRPLEFGRAIGALVRRLRGMPREQALGRLAEKHGLDPQAAWNLMRYLEEQARATGEPPHDRNILVESFVDAVGDWRIAILSPFGSRVHAPWAMAVAGRLRRETGGEVDMMWGDDGIVFRLPESDEPPGIELLIPSPEDVEREVTEQLGTTALFAAKFRENAARALLLPKRQAGRRTPLWLQRRKSADLLSAASRYPDFPILLETYRECLRDVFDVANLRGLLQDIQARRIRVHTARTTVPSPFAASLLFHYAANFLYDGDAPLAERRAQALALDHTQLRELLGEAELRDLLDGPTIEQLGLELQRLTEGFSIRDADGVHEMLLDLGDLSREELAARCDEAVVSGGVLDRWLRELVDRRRVIEVRVAGEGRYAAAEDAARFRDALGVALPPGLPAAFLENVSDPLGDLVARFARTHTPFKQADVASRFGLSVATVRAALERLASRDRVLQGEYLPGGRGGEWCDAEVLRALKRRSLARLRQQVEPVDPRALACFLPQWQGITQPGRGLDALLDAIEQLQGLPLPASVLERDILPCRVRGYEPNELDELCVAGEVVWQGVESLGSDDGRIALYLTDHFPALAAAATPAEGELAGRIRHLLLERGALFFEDLARAIGGFREDVLQALWDLVWAGELTNDTLAPLRSLRGERRRVRPRYPYRFSIFRSRRRGALPGSQGRWTLLPRPADNGTSATARQAALAAQLLRRYGVVTREMISAEGVPGGFAGLYPVFKAMEEAGKARRGYFVAGLGAAQFATPGAEDRLREPAGAAVKGQPETLVLAATDPANAYGAALPWPETPQEWLRPQRAAGARVILQDGRLLGYLGRTGHQLTTFLPESSCERDRARETLAKALAGLASPMEGVFLATVDGVHPGDSALADALRAAGFVPTSRGYLRRRCEEPG